MKFKKGDNVKVLTGKDRGKSGKIIKVFPEAGRLVVEGVNVFKKHSRPKRQGEKGEIVSVVRPLQVSNVSFVCSKCGKAARLGFRIEGDKKIRHCKRCNAEA